MLTLQRIEQIEQWRNRVLQRGIKRQDLGCYFFADHSHTVVGIDFEMMPQQFNDRQIRRGAPEWSGMGLQYEPPCSLGRTDEFVHEARFADARFANDRNHLGLGGAGKLLYAL